MSAERRRSSFFQACLDGESLAFAVLFVHGPGGIGKSSLLEAFAAAARRKQWRVVRLDGRDLLPSPEGVRSALDTGAEPTSTMVRDDSVDTVVLLDSYEIGRLDDWVGSNCSLSSPPTW